LFLDGEPRTCVSHLRARAKQKLAHQLSRPPLFPQPAEFTTATNVVETPASFHHGVPGVSWTVSPENDRQRSETEPAVWPSTESGTAHEEGERIRLSGESPSGVRLVCGRYRSYVAKYAGIPRRCAKLQRLDLAKNARMAGCTNSGRGSAVRPRRACVIAGRPVRKPIERRMRAYGK